MATPATRQLYVRFFKKFPRDNNDVREFFRAFSPSHANLLPKRDAAYVNFLSVEEAKRAKDGVNGTSLHGVRCDVQFNRATNLVCIPSVPLNFTDEKAKEVANQAFSKFGRFTRIEIVSKQDRAVRIAFESEKSAIDAVTKLQGHKEGSWKWELEFHRVQRVVTSRVFLLIHGNRRPSLNAPTWAPEAILESLQTKPCK